MNKKTIVLLFFLIFFVNKNQSLIAQSMVNSLDFRVPYSLTERLHEGFLSIEGSLQDFEGSSRSESLQQAIDIAQSLHGVYDSTIDKSKLNMVYRDDRDFLQNIIDRIDQLIHTLETKSLTVKDQELIRSGIDLLHRFRDKLGV